MFKLLLTVSAVAALLLLSVNGQSSDGNFIGDLNNIPYYQILGGPLLAAVEAQQSASEVTSQFIIDVGFTNTVGQYGWPVDGTTYLDTHPGVLNVNYLEFNYFAQDANGTQTTRSMSVPFLYIVPIPFLQIDSLTVDFTVQLNSLSQSNTTAIQRTGPITRWNTEVTYQLWGDQCWICINVNTLMATTTEQSATETSNKITKAYDLVISMRASQAAIPGGMARLLDIFDTLVETDLSPSNIPFTETPSTG